MNTPRATWFCIDIEANGPVPGLYDMVSLGATVVFEDENGTLQLGSDFYMELKPVAPRFDARAAAIHGLDQDRLASEGLSRVEAAHRLPDAVVRPAAGKRRLGAKAVGEQAQHRAVEHEQAARIELRFVAQGFQENFKRLAKSRAAEVRQARLPLRLVEQSVRV